MKIKRHRLETNWARWYIPVCTAIGILICGLAIVSCIKIIRWAGNNVQYPDKIKQIVHNVDSVPIPIQVPTHYWKSNTKLFLRAILLQENGPKNNPWNLTKDYLDDVYEFHPELRGGDLSDIDHAVKLVRVYNTRHEARDDYHAASMHRKGPIGCIGKTGQEYGQWVQNTLWLWESWQVSNKEPIVLDPYDPHKKIYSTPAPWARTTAKVEKEWD